QRRPPPTDRGTPHPAFAAHVRRTSRGGSTCRRARRRTAQRRPPRGRRHTKLGPAVEPGRLRIDSRRIYTGGPPRAQTRERWGNSLAVRIPADLAEACALTEGTELEVPRSTSSSAAS